MLFKHVKDRSAMATHLWAYRRMGCTCTRISSGYAVVHDPHTKQSLTLTIQA